jgi:hypothetical protein
MNVLGRGVLTAALLAAATVAAAETLNGFDVKDLSVDRALVQRGGPPRDGIPALTDPAFIAAEQAGLKGDDRVIGVAYNGVAKAYPLTIMNWHEVVNDQFGERAVVVTYCPLCFTGMAFFAEREGRRQTFGVSGLLYNSDVLLYDHATDSLWSQLARRAVSGPLNGTELSLLPTHNTTWAEWSRRYPDSLVLSRDTGYRRDYQRDPYLEYAASPELMFPVAFRAQGFHPKELVLGLSLGEIHRAYPVSELLRASLPVEETVAGQTLRVEYDDVHQSGRILDGEGTELSAVMAYWFAWFAFHPQTEIYRAPR